MRGRRRAHAHRDVVENAVADGRPSRSRLSIIVFAAAATPIAE